MDARAYVIRDRQRIDVTEEIKTVLDLLASSLDWGSGFLCADDIEAWYKIAEPLGVEVNGIVKTIDAMREDERIREKLDSEKQKYVYQVRRPNGEVIIELAQTDESMPVWVPPPDFKGSAYWWQNYGAGWRKIGKYPT